MNRAVSTLMAGSAIAAMGAVLTLASSHREAPLIRASPLVDNTDVYAFVSTEAERQDYVTLITNLIPLQEPAGGPNFFNFSDEAVYDIRIDNDGDAEEDITFEFRFRTEVLNPNTFLYNLGPISSLNDPNFNVRQYYEVTRIDTPSGSRGASRGKGQSVNRFGTTMLGSHLATPPCNIGPTSTPNYDWLAQEAVHDLGNGYRVFCGQRDEGFYVDLGMIFDLVSFRGNLPGDLGGGVDGTGGFNVNTIAIEVPISELTSSGIRPTLLTDASAVIGVWSTVRLPHVTTRDEMGGESSQGRLIQVSRLGTPLINEVIIPRGMKDRFNASEPRDDQQFAQYVLQPELPGILQSLYGITIPPTPRNDLVLAALTGIPGLNQPPNVVAAEMLRLNVAVMPTATPNRMGVLGGDLAGFPNGRRVGDDVTDILLRVVGGGVLVDGYNIDPNNRLGDGVDANDLPYSDVFPYLANPHPGFEHEHHRVEDPNASGDN